MIAAILLAASLSAPQQASSLDGVETVTSVSAPVRPHFDRKDWQLVIGDTTTRAMDAWTTRHVLNLPCTAPAYDPSYNCHVREAILPHAIASSTAGMWSYSLSMAALQAFGAHEMTRRGHRRMARMMLMGDIGQEAAYDVHNLTLRPWRQK
jgi:hypothetical protein